MKTKRKRKKPGKANPWILISIIIFLLVILALPYLLYLIQPTNQLIVSVYDKTVPSLPALQHEGLAWFLKHTKVPTDQGTIFAKDESYLGYKPQDEQPIVNLSELSEQTDLLYIADTYGIYTSDAGFSTTQGIHEGSNLIGEVPANQMLQ